MSSHMCMCVCMCALDSFAVSFALDLILILSNLTALLFICCYD